MNGMTDGYDRLPLVADPENPELYDFKNRRKPYPFYISGVANRAATGFGNGYCQGLQR